MTRLSQFITACVLLLTASLAPVFGDQNCKPVKKRGEEGPQRA